MGDALAALGWQVHEQLRRTVRSLAEVVEDAGPGWSARTPSLPLVHSLNRLHVPARSGPGGAGESLGLAGEILSLPGESLGLADEILAMADEHQADLGYRHVVVEDERTARQLVASLGSAGWRVERLVLMVLDTVAAGAGEDRSGEDWSGEARSGEARSGDRELFAEPVSELTAGEAAELMRRWAVEDRLEVVPGVIEQLAVYNDREGRLWNERALGIRQDGAPVALTKYRSDDGVAWVEDVYTVPEARGRGHARTLVTRAAGAAVAAGHELVFIVADDEDWPKELYRAIGFRPAARSWTFHKDLGAAGRVGVRAS